MGAPDHELLDGLPHNPESKYKESGIIADPSAKFETTSKRAGSCHEPRRGLQQK